MWIKLFIKPLFYTCIAVITLLLTACGDDSEKDTLSQDLPDIVDFNFHIKPILSDNCFLCHGPDVTNAKAGLSLNTFEFATEHVTESGRNPIVPGKIDKSEVYLRISSDDKNFKMPPPDSNLQLTVRDKAMIKKWIKQGAQYKKHWAFIPPEKAPVPKLNNQAWIKNPIDSFILDKLQKNKLTPNNEADKETLIRRVTFDLTGLPPSVEHIDAYLTDDSNDAYEKIVKRLLASTAFGERMAVEWLDVARYADTFGYSVDRYRDVSPYRDWVIHAFNNNMPFDQFVSWQLAGDLYPSASKEQRLATAFNRLHAQNAEGGIVNEEFRVEYVRDRVQTLGTGLLGLTLHCAQCHDHKYDAISTKEYYETFAMFNNIDESGQISWDANDIPVPTMLMPTSTEEKQLADVGTRINLAKMSLTQTAEAALETMRAWKKTTPLNHIDFNANDALIAHYPFSPSDTSTSIASAINTTINAKVLYGADINKKTRSDIVHIRDGKRNAILLNGDDPLYFPHENDFERARPFSVSIDAKLPVELQEGVLLHYNKGTILYNFKGFEISLEDNHWIVRLAHTFPYNAIALRSKAPVTKQAWLTIMLTYDGSSTASGVGFYINGQRQDMFVERDNLYKDIKHTDKTVLKEMGIKIGARWRGRGTPNTLVDNLKVWSRRLTALEVQAIAGLDINLNNDKQTLAFYNARYNTNYRASLSALTDLRKQQSSLAEPIFEMMVMKEMSERRPAYVLQRGSYASHGEAVEPGVPQSIFPYDPSLPKNRLGLAQWITDDKHPLMPRVVINRYWMMLLGTGIVRTPEDFGNQGELPTHPRLLDWLSREFVDSGWNIKHIITLIVTSSTYKQSSTAAVNFIAADPENRLYSRVSSTRLSAEMLRDNVLAASGLLVDKIGGKSVHPYQPEGLWRMNQAAYTQGSGEDLYRRSLYTIWKRSVPPPTMHNFDTPTRSYSVGTRQTTNTPLQALTLMNDPQYIEAGRVLAERVALMPITDIARLETMYRLLTSRRPDQQELSLLNKTYQQFLASFIETPENANHLLSVGDKEPDQSLETTVIAAYSIVANLIMNHDATVIKR